MEAEQQTGVRVIQLQQHKESFWCFDGNWIFDFMLQIDALELCLFLAQLYSTTTWMIDQQQEVTHLQQKHNSN